MEELKKVFKDISSHEIMKVTISNKSKASNELKKISINLKEKNGEDFYQVEKYTDKQ